MKKMKDIIMSGMMNKKQNNTTKEVIFKMKRGKGLKSKTYAVLTLISALALATLLIQAPAHGAVTCPSDPSSNAAQALINSDSDGDGLYDYDECYGIMLTDQTQTPPTTCICGSVGCCGTSNPVPSNRAIRFDPNTKDLFVILVTALELGGNHTNIPQPIPDDYLSFLSNSLAQGGLAITPHVIKKTQATPDRLLNSTPPQTQKAVRVTEILDTSIANLYGQSDGCGTPNGSDNSRVYTDTIEKFVTSVYAAANQQPPAGLIDTYIRHTIAHEIAHSLGPLAPTYNARFAGYHYKSGTKVEMDQSVYYTSKGQNVNFYIGTTFTSLDNAGIKLK